MERRDGETSAEIKEEMRGQLGFDVAAWDLTIVVRGLAQDAAMLFNTLRTTP